MRGEVEGKLRQHDGVVVMELVVLRQGFAKHYGGGRGVGGGRGLRQGKGATALSLSLTIYRGKGGGGGALGFPRGGAAATGETLDGFGRPHPLGNLPPKPGGAAALGVAHPPLQVT